MTPEALSASFRRFRCSSRLAMVASSRPVRFRNSPSALAPAKVVFSAAARLRLAREIELYYVQQNLAWGNLLLRGQDPSEYHNYLAAFYENERQTLDRAERLQSDLEGDAALHAPMRDFVQGLYQLRTQYREALRIYNASKQSQHATDRFLSAATRKPTEMLQEVERLLRAEAMDRDGAEIAGSAPVVFKGDGSRASPEDLLVASLSACHLLTYLALAARKGIRVTAYEDAAEGTIAQTSPGKIKFVEAALRPRVRVADAKDVAAATALHHDAHERCFVASSVNFPVRVEPVVTA